MCNSGGASKQHCPETAAPTPPGQVALPPEVLPLAGHFLDPQRGDRHDWTVLNTYVALHGDAK